MGVMAEIKLQGILSIWEALRAWKREGWEWEHEGMVRYLPLGDASWSQWYSAPLRSHALMQLMQTKENIEEPLGLELHWRNSDQGVLLLYQRGSIASLKIHKNRKIARIERPLSNATSWDWYVSRLVQPLMDEGILSWYQLEETWF